MTTSVSIVGSTGSIGTQTLEVIAAEPDRFRVAALGAFRSVELLAEQARTFRPDVVAVVDPDAAKTLQSALPNGTELVAGAEALVAISGDADVIVNAVVGFAGLGVTLKALTSGRRLALANKESLISAGPVVQRVRDTPGAELVPIDSEHGAIHQCLRSGSASAVDGGAGADRAISRLVLTASGGPFRGRSRADLQTVTIADALAHPTWSMGPKITIDSSTLMNKGLEVIEAHELFGCSFDDIDVVVHPQSIVHSMVEFADGTTIAQLSEPDMRLPIGYALAYPDRIGTPFGRMDWTTSTRLDFEPPDLDAFPCLRLSYDAGRAGETAPTWLSGANEVAVDAFLNEQIPWLAIPEVLERVLDRHDGSRAESAEAVVAADRTARAVAAELLSNGVGIPS